MTTERQWSRAKAHVARGHDEETRRLRRKGMRIGGAVGVPILAADVLRALKTKRLPHPLAALAIPAGMGAGYLAGSHAALKRLELSQRRQDHGHYAPFPKTSGVLSETATQTRRQIWATKRPMVKPVVHKPQVVKTPAPAPPQVEPATQTPTMSPVMKTGAVAAMKKLKVKAGEPGQTWRGQKATTKQRPGPENEPEPESWRGRDF